MILTVPSEQSNQLSLFIFGRFYGRDSMIYKFQLHAGILSKGSSPSGRRLVAFTFHPSAPFAISVQRAANAEYLAHFHLRLDPFAVMPL